MFVNRKNLSSFIVLSSLFLSSCQTIDTIPNLEQEGMTAQSFSSSEGKVPDNGDINIKLDNKVLARRTFNNADPIMHIDGAEAYPAIEKLIDNAQKSIYIETFIFHDDATGRRIADKIVAKHKQGVEVKILIDALGIAIKKADERMFDYFKTQGIDVKKYNKSFLGIHGINITHRKLFIIDGDKALTGGMNIGEEYEKVWHDSLTEFQGEVVQDMQREFFINWKKSGGQVPENPPLLIPNKIYGNTPMRVTVTTANEQNRRYQIKDSILTLIDNAKDKITFFGAYFSDDDLIAHLISASKRGVDVEVIMPKKGDSKIFDKINPATAKDFLKNNVKVFFYQPRFSHIKTAIIDKFTIVGSANPDARSFRENQELNVIIENEIFRKDIETRLVSRDISQATVETLDTVKVSFGKRIAQTFLEVVDYYL